MSRRCIHAIVASRNRNPILTEDVLSELFLHLNQVAKRRSMRLDCANGSVDHIHLLVWCRPVRPMVELMRFIREAKESWNWKKRGRQFPLCWRAGCHATLVDEEEVEIARHYIEHQEAHHRWQTLEEECARFFKKNPITIY